MPNISTSPDRVPWKLFPEAKELQTDECVRIITTGKGNVAAARESLVKLNAFETLTEPEIKLFRYAEGADVDALKKLLADNPDLDVNFVPNGMMSNTPLGRACQIGYSNRHKALVKEKQALKDPEVAATNEEKHKEETAAIQPAKEAAIETVECLLQHGANPNVAGYYGDTALYRTIASANKEVKLDIVVLLLQRGANAHAENGAKDNPLSEAAANYTFENRYHEQGVEHSIFKTIISQLPIENSKYKAHWETKKDPKAVAIKLLEGYTQFIVPSSHRNPRSFFSENVNRHSKPLAREMVKDLNNTKFENNKELIDYFLLKLTRAIEQNHCFDHKDSFFSILVFMVQQTTKTLGVKSFLHSDKIIGVCP